MLAPPVKIFMWNESRQEKSAVAATASSDCIKVYYALENTGARPGASCSVSSQSWYGQMRRYEVEEVLVLD